MKDSSEIIDTGNGVPTNRNSFQQKEHKVSDSVELVRSSADKGGTITATDTADGLQSAQTIFKTT